MISHSSQDGISQQDIFAPARRAPRPIVRQIWHSQKPGQVDMKIMSQKLGEKRKKNKNKKKGEVKMGRLDNTT